MSLNNKLFFVYKINSDLQASYSVILNNAHPVDPKRPQFPYEA